MTLSAKINSSLVYLCALRFDKDCNAEQFAEATDRVTEDVKEFIRKLKEEYKNFFKDRYGFSEHTDLPLHKSDIIWFEKEIIDKLAGKELLE